MECDSAHANIERKLRNLEIYTSYDFIKVTKKARHFALINGVKRKMSYDVENMKHTDFYNYCEPHLQKYATIRPGKRTNDPTVSNIRSLIYLPNGNILFKLDYDDEYEELPNRPKTITNNYSPKKQFKHRIKITENKWKHLQSFKNIIPNEYHNFYDTLGYNKDSSKEPVTKRRKILKE